MLLSVPVPPLLDKVQEVAFISADPEHAMTIYACTVSSLGRIADLKAALFKFTGVSVRRMVVTNIYQHRIEQFWDDDGSLSRIKVTDNMVCYELQALDGYKEPALLLQVVHQRFEKNATFQRTLALSQKYTAFTFGVPRILCFPRNRTARVESINAQLHQLEQYYFLPTKPKPRTAVAGAGLVNSTKESTDGAAYGPSDPNAPNASNASQGSVHATDAKDARLM